MRDLFDDIFTNQPLDPTEAARGARCVRNCGGGSTSAPRSRRARGTKRASASCSTPVRCETPARRALAAPVRPLAEALAAEWEAQREVIDPAKMPLTRLANTIIDGVADAACGGGRGGRKISRDSISSSIAPRRPMAWWRAKPRPGTRCSPGRARLWARASCRRRGWCSRRSRADALAAAAAAVPRDPWRLGALHAATDAHRLGVDRARARARRAGAR